MGAVGYFKKLRFRQFIQFMLNINYDILYDLSSYSKWKSDFKWITFYCSSLIV